MKFNSVEEMLDVAAKRGRLIEVGWLGLRLAAINPNASETQLREMRMAFFAGAQHLLSSIMTTLGPEKEPTEEDLKKISMIHSELESFLAEFTRTSPKKDS